MFIVIPGWFITFCTFPGIVSHEIGHRLFCDLAGVPVYKIRYFIFFSKTAGCVIHRRTSRLKHVFFITMGPFILNSVLSFLFFLPFAGFMHTQIYYGFRFSLIAYLVLGWIASTMAFNAFPSNQDLKNLKEVLPEYANRRKHFYTIWICYLIFRLCSALEPLTGFLYALFMLLISSGFMWLVLF